MALVKYESAGRVRELDRVLIEDSRDCPYCANGTTRRLAERELTVPYTWRPVGYRCNMCGQVWLDNTVQIKDAYPRIKENV